MKYKLKPPEWKLPESKLVACAVCYGSGITSSGDICNCGSLNVRLQQIDKLINLLQNELDAQCRANVALLNICAEAYQVVGALSTLLPDNHEGIIKAMDNLSAAANEAPIPHYTMLPFVIEEKK